MRTLALALVVLCLPLAASAEPKKGTPKGAKAGKKDKVDPKKADASKPEAPAAEAPPPAPEKAAPVVEKAPPPPAEKPAPAPAAVAAPAPAAAPVEATSVATAEAAPSGVGLLAGVHFGGVLPFSGVKPTVGGALDVGVLFPVLSRGLGVLLTVAYSQPGSSGTVTDPRVGGGSYDWKLTQQQLTLTPTVLYRMTGLGRLVPYGALGFRIFLLKDTVSGSANGQAMTPTVEQVTRYGLAARLGAEFTLGPGGLTLEAQYEWATLATVAAGAHTNLSGVTVQVGYRLIL